MFYVKNKKGLYRIILLSFALCVCMIVMCHAVSAECTTFNWYCIHAKDHEQPRADAQLADVERHGGYYIDHKYTSPIAREKVVYLTFDAGYENGNVSKILDVMKDEGVSGAFFILGNLITSNPELVKRMADEGHLVCNHTYSHRDMSNRSCTDFEAELKKLEDVSLEKAGVKLAKYYRPPEGKFSTEMLDNAKKLGYKTIFWSFAYADWDNGKQMPPDKALTKIVDNIHNGAVILLHPTSDTNAKIMRKVIQEIKSQGYRFGSLDELTGR